MNFIEFENREVIIDAIKFFKKYPVDLEDCYNIAFYRKNRLDKFASFDKKVSIISKIINLLIFTAFP